jgi:ribosome-associated protein
LSPSGGGATLAPEAPGTSTDQGSLATPHELALTAATIADEKKAKDIVLLDMRDLVSYTDHLVICTGQTPRQTKAIAEEIRHKLKTEHGVIPRRIEGEREGDWILVDLLDVVVHVFTPESREFYRLERLWREAPRERLEPQPAAEAAAGT